MVEIDGSLLEGGGQILRTSVCLSAVTGKPLRIYNIRAKRSKPGLRPQHLTAVAAVAELTGAEVEGLEMDSREVEFAPRDLRCGAFQFDIGTAGSSTLLLQSLLPVAAYAPGEVSMEIHGGTNNPLSPPIDYLRRVLLPALGVMGFQCRIELLRRGFYPRGGGGVAAKVQPVKRLRPIRLMDFGEVRRVRGLSYSSRLPRHIVERMAKSAEDRLRKWGCTNVAIGLESLQAGEAGCALDPGFGIILVAELSNGALIGADRLGEIGKRAERVGLEAAEDLIRQLERQAPVDRHMGDQLIMWMGLAEGASAIKVSELTLHAVTCIAVCKSFLEAKFEIQGRVGDMATVRCDGVGVENRLLKVD